MRELKFRVWIKDEERYYDESDEESYTIVPNGNVTYTSEAYEEDGVFYTDTTNATNNVVVEQYTGLKDKNGKEIYEGDVVHYTEKIAPNKSSTYEVYYDQLHAMYALSPVDGKIDVGEFYGYIMRQQYEVIGNIHENPELLEGEK